MRGIRILVVDSVRLFREGLAQILDCREGLTVVGMARDSEEALARIQELTPQIVLLDMADAESHAIAWEIGNLTPQMFQLRASLLSETDREEANRRVNTFKNAKTASNWIALEDGVEIQFGEPAPRNANVYRSGDCWLIPARVATGDVLWPLQKTAGAAVKYPSSGNPKPAAPSPHGVEHHYPPLGIIKVAADKVEPTVDLSRTFAPLAT